MNLTKCKNGHYYDADRYDSCPHCGESNGNDHSAVNVENPPVKPTPSPVKSGVSALTCRKISRKVIGGLLLSFLVVGAICLICRSKDTH